jgi:ribosomal protein S18 acetylase RimI-like enzyme
VTSEREKERSGAAPALRRAVPGDAAAIGALVRDAYGHYVARIGREPQPMTVDYDLAVREHQVWVLDGADSLRAVLELMPDHDSLLIVNVAVDPRAQGSGIGRKLMDFAEQEARRQGFTSLTLYTNEKMTENIALYTRLGYVETERRAIGQYRRVFMRKDLSD